MDTSLNISMTQSNSSLGGPSPATTPAKKKLKKKKGIDTERTYRFQLSLNSVKGSKNFSQFNWLDLVAKEEEEKVETKRKRIEAELTKVRGTTQVLDPYASDDDDQLKALARKFEAKYGGAVENIKKKKKERKLNDCADLGYGYDSNDSFIDNSDVHDEVVPTNITTALGGFYINCGNLEFKTRESADEDSDVEAVYREGEKAAAAKKRQHKRMMEEDSDDGGPTKKKVKMGGFNGADGSASSDGGSRKQRARKQGSKPLGRPKKRSPDGTLVHPPKPPRLHKFDASGQLIPRKKLSGGNQFKRKIMKVLPPGSTNVFTGKPLNPSEGTKDSPIDLTSGSPAVVSSPSAGSSMPAPKFPPAVKETPVRTMVTPVQLKTVETSPNSMIQDQLVGDAIVRAPTSAIIDPTRPASQPVKTPNVTQEKKKEMTLPTSGQNLIAKKQGEASLIATKKAPSTPNEATLIAAKKVPTPGAKDEATKFSQQSPSTSLPQQIACPKEVVGSNVLLQSVNKGATELVAAKAKTVKQQLNQQLQQKKQVSGAAAKSPGNENQAKNIESIYKKYYAKMQLALSKGDKAEYEKLMESLKTLMETLKSGMQVKKQVKPNQQQPPKQNQQVAKQNQHAATSSPNQLPSANSSPNQQASKMMNSQLQAAQIRQLVAKQLELQKARIQQERAAATEKQLTAKQSQTQTSSPSQPQTAKPNNAQGLKQDQPNQQLAEQKKIIELQRILQQEKQLMAMHSQTQASSAGQSQTAKPNNTQGLKQDQPNQQAAKMMNSQQLAEHKKQIMAKQQERQIVMMLQERTAATEKQMLAKQNQLKQDQPKQIPVQSPKQTQGQVSMQMPGEAFMQSPTQVPKQSPALAPKQSPAQVPKQSPAQAPKQSLAQVPKQSPVQVPKQSPAQVPKQSTSQVPKLNQPQGLQQSKPGIGTLDGAAKNLIGLPTGITIESVLSLNDVTKRETDHHHLLDASSKSSQSKSEMSVTVSTVQAKTVSASSQQQSSLSVHTSPLIQPLSVSTSISQTNLQPTTTKSISPSQPISFQQPFGSQQQVDNKLSAYQQVQDQISSYSSVQTQQLSRLTSAPQTDQKQTFNTQLLQQQQQQQSKLPSPNHQVKLTFSSQQFQDQSFSNTPTSSKPEPSQNQYQQPHQQQMMDQNLSSFSNQHQQAKIPTSPQQEQKLNYSTMSQHNLYQHQATESKLNFVTQQPEQRISYTTQKSSPASIQVQDHQMNFSQPSHVQQQTAEQKIAIIQSQLVSSIQQMGQQKINSGLQFQQTQQQKLPSPQQKQNLSNSNQQYQNQNQHQHQAPKVLGYASKLPTSSTASLPSMNSPTPSMHILSVENASQLLAAMQPQSPSYAPQYNKQTTTTPPKSNMGNNLMTSPIHMNQGLYGSTATSPVVSRASPVHTSSVNNTQFCSNIVSSQQVNRVHHQQGNSTTPTGYAKVSAPSSMSSPPSKNINYFSPIASAASSSVSVTLPTLPLPTSTSISQQLSAGNNMGYFTSSGSSNQQHQQVVIPSLLKPQTQQSLLLQQQQQLQQQQAAANAYFGLNN